MKTPQKSPRKFIAENAELDKWNVLEPYFLDLKDREIPAIEDFKKWLFDLSELEAVLEEHVAWKYIKMTINTSDEKLAQDYQHFVTELQPKIAPFSDELNKKLVHHPCASELEGKAYSIYLTKLGLEIKQYREVNVPIQSEMRKKSQEYGALTGGLSVEHNGETLTMPAASALLQKPDRKLR
ncbi:MAG: M3 family oligoendopeptidase, partial [Flavobacteriales bacterium]